MAHRDNASVHSDPAPLADDVLVTGILAGEKALYAQLMRRYNQRLYRIVRAIVRSEHEAEDIVQHTYVTAYHKLTQFRGEAAFGTWLTRIAVHEALGRLRKTTRRGDVSLVEANAEGKLDGHHPSPEDETYRHEMGRLLESQVDGLPETLRVVFVMREVEELNTSETASCLGISEEAVRVRLHRARMLLQERLSRVMEAAPEAFRFLGDRCDRIVAAVLGALDISL